jgi:hypothetical protein
MIFGVCGTQDSCHPPPHLDICVKVKCVGSGSPCECGPPP